MGEAGATYWMGEVGEWEASVRIAFNSTESRMLQVNMTAARQGIDANVYSYTLHPLRNLTQVSALQSLPSFPPSPSHSSMLKTRITKILVRNSFDKCPSNIELEGSRGGVIEKNLALVLQGVVGLD